MILNGQEYKIVNMNPGLLKKVVKIEEILEDELRLKNNYVDTIEKMEDVIVEAHGNKFSKEDIDKNLYLPELFPVYLEIAEKLKEKAAEKINFKK